MIDLNQIKKEAFEDELQKIALSAATLDKASTGLLNEALSGGRVRGEMAKALSARIQGTEKAPMPYIKRYAREASGKSVMYL